MKRILVAGIMFVIAGMLVSCSARYDMNGLRKLKFERPAGWELVTKQDDYTYDYVFRFQNQGEWFEAYLRVMYVPGQNAMLWLKESKKKSRDKGCVPGRIETFSSPKFRWYMMETEDTAELDGRKTPISVREYAAKEKKSARLIQCFIVGRKDSFVKLPAGEVNAFIDSIELKDVKLPAREDPKYYRNYLSTAEEGVFLLIGKKLFASGKYARAINVYNSLLNRRLSPKLKTRIDDFLSECYLEKGVPVFVSDGDLRDFQDGLNYAKESLKLDKKYWPAYLNAGIAYANMREYGQAKEFFKKALQNCSKKDPVYRLLQFHYDTCKASFEFKSSLAGMFSGENKVTGFVYSEKDPIVIISGKPYRVGAKLNAYTILKITRTAVIMKFGSRIYEFSMNDFIPELEKNKDVQQGK